MCAAGSHCSRPVCFFAHNKQQLRQPCQPGVCEQLSAAASAGTKALECGGDQAQTTPAQTAVPVMRCWGEAQYQPVMVTLCGDTSPACVPILQGTVTSVAPQAAALTCCFKSSAGAITSMPAAGPMLFPSASSSADVLPLLTPEPAAAAAAAAMEAGRASLVLQDVSSAQQGPKMHPPAFQREPRTRPVHGACGARPMNQLYRGSDAGSGVGGMQQPPEQQQMLLASSQQANQSGMSVSDQHLLAGMAATGSAADSIE